MCGRSPRLMRSIQAGRHGVTAITVFTWSANRDVDVVGGIDHAINEGLPVAEIRSGGVDLEILGHDAVDLVAPQVERALVDGVLHVAKGDHVLGTSWPRHSLGGKLLRVARASRNQAESCHIATRDPDNPSMRTQF